MEDFSKYFHSMIENLLKSGSGEISFDIKAFDSKNVPDFLRLLFENKNKDKIEKLAVRKLTDEEIEQHKFLIESQDKIKYQLRKLMAHQKKLDIDFDLFWQDIQQNTEKKVNIKDLSIDSESGFLFQEVNVSKKEEEQDK